MKNVLSITLAAAFALCGPAFAGDEPAPLTEAEMDQVTAGVGANNVAAEPWPALLEAGFTLNHNPNADQGVIDHAGKIGVAVPSAVPGSFCVAFCS